MNILFLYNNLIDEATLTASSEATGFPASNLTNPFRTKVWRTAGAIPGMADLVIDHSTPRTVTCVALVNYSWTSTPSTFTFEANATNAWGAPSFSQALTWAANPTANFNKGCIIQTFAGQTYRYNRLNVTYTPGDWDLGKIYVGTYFQPTVNYSLDWSQNIVDPSIISRSIGGQDHIDQIEKYREFDFSFLVATQAQWESFQTMINYIGINTDLFIAFDYTDEPDELTVYGKFTALPGAANIGPAYKRIGFSFRESR